MTDNAEKSRLPVPLLDVNRGNAPFQARIAAAIADVSQSGRFLYGPDVVELEKSIAAKCETKHAIGCASGSDALLLSLMALGVGAGDEVITPSFTFFATASAAWRLGAKPVFLDIDPISFNIDPQLLEDAITPRTKAIIPVHLFGQCAEMSAINEIAGRHDLPVIEDAAQAIGAKYHDKPAGGLGCISCFSFYPTKNLGGFGDGGMLTTNDDDLAACLRRLAAHGMEPRYYHREVGINSRLDSIQAAVLRIKLEALDQWTQSRQENAALYQELFADAGLQDELTLPVAAAHQCHVWNQYTIRIPGNRRNALREYLAAQQIGSEIYYPVPLHQQECFASLGYEAGSLPHTERAAQEVLSLPIFPELRDDEQQSVVAGIRQFLAQAKASAA